MDDIGAVISARFHGATIGSDLAGGSPLQRSGATVQNLAHRGLFAGCFSVWAAAAPAAAERRADIQGNFARGQVEAIFPLNALYRNCHPCIGFPFSGDRFKSMVVRDELDPLSLFIVGTNGSSRLN